MSFSRLPTVSEVGSRRSGKRIHRKNGLALGFLIVKKIWSDLWLGTEVNLNWGYGLGLLFMSSFGWGCQNLILLIPGANAEKINI